MQIGDLYKLIRMALEEDLGEEGDVTSGAVFTDQRGYAFLLTREPAVLAGSFVFEEVYKAVDPAIEVVFHEKEGNAIPGNTVIAEIRGKTASILSGERTALNFLSFLSGIATETRKYVQAADDKGNAVILDTRKTLPGYRELSKYAVRTGGGKNHRMGLYDMVLIKDNHIDAAGSITEAVGRVRSRWGDRFTIEVECRNCSEVQEALDVQANIIMLDNMTAQECSVAVKLGTGKVLFEASGDMTPERVSAYSEAGVDYISVGRLTHSVRSTNFSLLINKEKGSQE